MVGIDVEKQQARAFYWRNYQYIRNTLEISNMVTEYQTFKLCIADIAQKHGKTAVIPSITRFK